VISIFFKRSMNVWTANNNMTFLHSVIGNWYHIEIGNTNELRLKPDV
jgi:hypothetical protein